MYDGRDKYIDVQQTMDDLISGEYYVKRVLSEQTPKKESKIQAIQTSKALHSKQIEPTQDSSSEMVIP